MMHQLLRIFHPWQSCLAALAMLCTLAACSDTGEEPVIRFPEAQTLQMSPGSTATLTFESQADHWELISEQPVWCRLSYGSQQAAPSVLGGAGTIRVEVTVNEDLASFREASTALLTLCIEGREATIATIVRAPLATTLTLWQEGTEIAEGGEIRLGYDGETQLQVESNAGIPAISYAEWLDVTTDGEGGYTLSLQPQYSLRYPIREGYLLLTVSQQGEVVREYRYPVSFAGMDPQKIRIRGYQYQPAGQTEVYTLGNYGWEVSADGETLTLVRANGDVVEVHQPLSLQVEALNDAVVYATLAEDHFVPVSGEEPFHISQDESLVTVGFDPLPPPLKRRDVAIYAFPVAAWQRFGTLTLSEEETYSEYVLLSYTQRADAHGFAIEYYDWTSGTLNELAVDEEVPEMIQSFVLMYAPALAVEEIYTLHVGEIPLNPNTGNKALLISTLYKENEWHNGNEHLNYSLVNLVTGEDLLQADGYAIDAGLSLSGVWQFDLGFPGTQKMPILLLLYDPLDSTKVLKALVLQMD